MKILILSKYSQKGASSRYRFYNYLPYFESNQINCEFNSLFNDNYIINLYEGKKGIVKLLQLWAIVKRTLFLLFNRKKYSLVIIEKELFPNVPYFFEKWLLGRRKYAMDFDDYVGASYKTHKVKKMFLKNKIDELVEFAAFTTVGNKWYFKEFKKGRLYYLPTVIDLQSYKLIKENFEINLVTIVWIGSPSTAKYLTLVKDVLQELSKEHKIRLKVIGAEIDFTGIEIKNTKWDAATESLEIYTSDIGIMPLSTTLWEKGKCGFKLIQYMASGLPVVCSPSPANEEIVKHGINGFIAESEQQWKDALKILIVDVQLRKSFGKNARKTIEENYSYQIWGDRYAGLIKRDIL